ncbi:MAG: aminopeptidase P family N-terminal domain-containing protein, partial [Anaerovoracaceae bacterium]
MEREQREIEKKLQAAMEEENFDVLLLTRPESIRYATGVTSAFMYLNIPIGNVIGIVPRTGKAAVVMSEFEGNAAK